MKYFTNIFPVVMIFFFACSPAGNNDSQKDTTQHAAVQVDSAKGDNLVKAEAPDAISKTTQGYALPRSGDQLAQSPINILSDSVINDPGQPVALTFNTGITAIENLGHTIQLDFKDGSTTMAGGKTYFSKQFHFHTPSEHLIDGMTFPLEMHIVNVSKESTADHIPKYMVIALLFKMGHENKFLKEFINAIPAGEEKDTLPAGAVNFGDLFNAIPKNEGAYYTYKGSLTTPPYSETVDWVIKKYILEASPEQINTIEKMEGDNARHVQALHARKVESHS